ncbi:lantibiotic dehydratase [Nonomuraea sp. NPDC049152]|uniref:lantibiotic dehydratase n=1 Tax=Nonomuraea sp. NPDC049152 TaxID=3154350 RepID=UPI0033DF1EE6
MQISAPAPYTVTENVARVPQVLAHVLPVGEPPADPAGDVRQVAVDDIAVTADRDGIHLVSRSLGRPIEPVAFNAVHPILHTHPLARFLMEAPQALRAPCTGFDWGAAAALPFLPALRYGRTVISPAR